MTTDGAAVPAPVPASVEVLRYTAFSEDPDGGNPAGVVLDARSLSRQQMLDIAADVGFSETAFLSPAGDRFDVRYFSPLDEVTFCGHATIAAGVAHAERHGPGRLLLSTQAGDVEVVTERSPTGRWRATLTSVAPTVTELDQVALDDLLRALRWSRDDLDPRLPAQVSYAGAFHPVIAVRSRERLARLDYDFGSLAQLMAERGWTTVNLVWREDTTTFHARNPFPPGGVREDAATGAAAAALGGYLRAGGHVPVPAVVTVRQGVDMGRPSTLQVDIPADVTSGIAVSGTAVVLPPDR